MSRSNPTKSEGPLERVRKLRISDARVMVGIRLSKGLLGSPLNIFDTLSVSRSARKARCSSFRASFIASISSLFPL